MMENQIKHLSRVFTDGNEAIRYAEGQSTLYGAKQPVERGKFGHYAYGNGFKIVEIATVSTAEERVQQIAEDKRQKALAKLTPEDRKLLGLAS